ncbi:MAG: cytochrome C [Bacteroidetes bacterium]|nr:MAG: cytochrome C [Bacteroidota bacterium]
MKKYLKPVLWGLLGLLVLIQFYRPEKNQSNDQTNHIRTRYPIPQPVEDILAVACYDCHSNYTRYPWYAAIQPVGLWLANHVDEGKSELNFSELAARPAALQYHKLEEVIELVQEGEMPLFSYTITHRDAVLSAEQQDQLAAWARGARETMKAIYPQDSLERRRRRR